MAYLEMFSEERIALNKELAYHPALMELLGKHAMDEFEIRLAEIAAYCGVVVDGDYLSKDLDRLVSSPKVPSEFKCSFPNLLLYLL